MQVIEVRRSSVCSKDSLSYGSLTIDGAVHSLHYQGIYVLHCGIKDRQICVIPNSLCLHYFCSYHIPVRNTQLVLID